MMMLICVNGENIEIDANATVEMLIAQVGLANQAVAVEINEELVPKIQHKTHMLKPSDRVELATLVGGG